MNAGPVLCAGILVADVFVPCLPRLPAAGELSTTEDFLVDAGGCAANTAQCLARLGVASKVVGRVGRDHFGEFVIDHLAQAGIDTSMIARSDSRATSKTVILPVEGEDRRYIHTIGANADVIVDDFRTPPSETPSVLYLGGYLVLPGVPPQGLAKCLAEFRQKGVVVVLDVVAPGGRLDHAMDDLRTVLPHVDVFMPNVEEGRALTGESEPARQTDVFLAAGCEIAIVTLGEGGALLATRDGVIQAPPIAVESVDESGAGDAFAAGFICGMVEGLDLQESLKLASIVGASACRSLGCHAGVFTRQEAEECLRSTPMAMAIRRGRTGKHEGGPTG